MKFAVAAASAALLASSVNAHGYLIQPAAKFKPGVMTTNYNGLIDSSTVTGSFAGKKFNDNPDNNVKTFTEAFKASTYKDIKSMMDPVVPDCGNTLTDGTPVDVSGLKSVQWGNDQEKKGFVTSHTGPCEVWIDDVMVMHEDNCVGKFTGYPADIPVDFSACKGDCKLTFYWLALHEPKWQVYKQCVPIKNGSGGGSASTPATTTAPSANTKPSSGNGKDVGGNTKPATNPKPATQAPSPASPSAPAPTKKSCKRRRALRSD